MAKQLVDIGSSDNKGDGDPLRTAFRKINDNFNELYAASTLDPAAIGSSFLPDTDATYNMGSTTKRWADLHVADFIYLNGARIEITGSGALLINGGAPTEVQDVQGSVFGDDSTTLVDAVNNVINLDGTISGNVVPDTNEAYDLGSASNRFRDLYLSGSTIDLGGTTLSIVGGNLQVGGTDIKDVVTAAGVEFGDLTVTPTTLAGYGITDAYTQAEVDAAIAAQNHLPQGDLQGSVFADDSTLLVDGVAGKIVGAIDTAQEAIFKDSIVLQNSNDIVTLGDGYGASFQLPNKSFSILGGGVGGGSYNIAFTANGSGSILATNQFNILGGSSIHIGTATGLTINNTVTVDAAVTAPSFVGDLTGSVFADDSTLLVDGVNGSIPYSVISDVQVTESDLLVDWAGIVGTQIQTNGLPTNTFTNGDLEVRGTLSFDTGTADFADTSIQNFAPGNIYANSGQYLYVVGKYAGGSATNVAFIYDAGNNRPRQTFYGKTEFGNNGAAPIVDFDGTTIENWSDPDVVNEHGGSAVITVGIQTASMDNLTVRIVENSPGDIDVEFNYDAGATATVSANGDLANRFSGTTTFAAGNTTWTTMNILNTVGDKGEFTIVDHSYHKIYRVTTFAKALPAPGTAGDAYCVIERLK